MQKEEARAQAAAQLVSRPAGSLAACLNAASPIQYNIVPHSAPVASRCQVKPSHYAAVHSNRLLLLDLVAEVFFWQR